MLRHLIAFTFTLQLVFAAPQFVSFKDGKIGVNFGGYHAAAGLGGLLTGNAAHGGLSASAGTPWGPQAAAGLGGNLDGRAAGGAYAGAQFSPEIGASSVLGGNVGGGRSGFIGAEAHSNGNVVSKSYGGVGSGISDGAEVGAGVGGGVNGGAAASAGAQYAPAPPQATDNNGRVNSIQKIKPPKKYNLIKTEDASLGAAPAHSKQVVKTYYKEVHAPSAHAVVAPAVPTNLHAHVPTGHAVIGAASPSYDQQVPAGGAYHTSSANLNFNSGLVGNVLNIPIGILRSLQESLSGININKSVSYTKLV